MAFPVRIASDAGSSLLNRAGGNDASAAGSMELTHKFESNRIALTGTSRSPASSAGWCSSEVLKTAAIEALTPQRAAKVIARPNRPELFRHATIGLGENVSMVASVDRTEQPDRPSTGTSLKRLGSWSRQPEDGMPCGFSSGNSAAKESPQLQAAAAALSAASCSSSSRSSSSPQFEDATASSASTAVVAPHGDVVGCVPGADEVIEKNQATGTAAAEISFFPLEALKPPPATQCTEKEPVPEDEEDDCEEGLVTAQPTVEEREVEEAPVQRKAPLKLTLPLPLRRDVVVVDPHDSPREEPAPALLPFPAAPQPSSGLQSRRAPAALRSGRQLPARLQALDDETVMPREMYNNMLKLGDQARGRLGYGQHKLTFVGPEGTPVLKLAAAA